jgi:hypothetical protein
VQHKRANVAKIVFTATWRGELRESALVIGIAEFGLPFSTALSRVYSTGLPFLEKEEELRRGILFFPWFRLLTLVLSSIEEERRESPASDVKHAPALRPIASSS